MKRQTVLNMGARLLLALAVTALTLAVVERASAVVQTPNAALFSYNLAANTHGGAITPPANIPVFVMGTCTTLGVRGVGHVSMLHIQSSFLEWVGLNSTFNGTIAQGFSGAAGTKIVQLDFSGDVWLTVAGTDSFYVQNNNATSARTGNVTLIW